MRQRGGLGEGGVDVQLIPAPLQDEACILCVRCRPLCDLQQFLIPEHLALGGRPIRGRVRRKVLIQNILRHDVQPLRDIASHQVHAVVACGNQFDTAVQDGYLCEAISRGPCHEPGSASRSALDYCTPEANVDRGRFVHLFGAVPQLEVTKVEHAVSVISTLQLTRRPELASLGDVKNGLHALRGHGLEGRDEENRATDVKREEHASTTRLRVSHWSCVHARLTIHRGAVRPLGAHGCDHARHRLSVPLASRVRAVRGPYLVWQRLPLEVREHIQDLRVHVREDEVEVAMPEEQGELRAIGCDEGSLAHQQANL
mmetsp:Transcript_12844/g.45488  ORF Transcript_12844/g.45488 Transcript_12844/m.45488 type:complete len:314 (+) Transcript_12844:4378-5319(+)